MPDWIPLLFAGWLMFGPLLLVCAAVYRFYAKHRHQRRRQTYEHHVFTIQPGRERYSYRHARQPGHSKRN